MSRQTQHTIPIEDSNSRKGSASLAPAEQTLGDLRFRQLLGAEAWSRLPSEVRDRFSKRLHAGKTVTYTGIVRHCRMSRTGWLLSQALRLIGGPLPISRDTGVAATVAVTEDGTSHGQFWTRQYGRRRGFPHIVHSSKRFRGPTGLEEYVGCGVGVALLVSTDRTSLHFDSDHYFIGIGPLRLPLPAWLSPGQMRVSHTSLDSEQFDFILSLRHGLLGELVHQRATFRERR